MSRRWQADGISFWRKLFSSNWWWYGEVNPDPASLPPIEKRPKFWRWKVTYGTFLLFGTPTIILMLAELNSRYWPFNHTMTYVGRIVDSRYLYPQLKVELVDKTIIPMAFPTHDPFQAPGKGRPIKPWVPLVDQLTNLQYDCPDRLLAFDTDLMKFTINPFFGIWEVRCASGSVLISQKKIVTIWTSYRISGVQFILGVMGPIFVFFAILIIRRERKRYVKG